MPFALEQEARHGHASFGECGAHVLGLIRRHDAVLGALKEDHRAVDAVGMVDGRAPFDVLCRHQAIDVARLELVRVACQCPEVADAVVAGAGAEGGGEGKSREGCVAAGAAAANGGAGGIDAPVCREVTQAGDAIVHVHHPPAAFEALAIGTAVAGAAAVVDVGHGPAPRGVVLGAPREVRGGAAGGPAVSDDQQRRALARHSLQAAVARRMEPGMAVAERGGEGDVLSDGDDLLRNRQAAATGYDRDLPRRDVDDAEFAWGIGSTADAGDAALDAGEAAEGVVGRVHGARETALAIDDDEPLAAVLHPPRDEQARRRHDIPMAAEAPGGPGVLRIVVQYVGDAGLVPCEEVPVAAGVRGEDQALAVPFRLHDGLADAAGNGGEIREPTARSMVRNEELGAVPRHVRMIPGEECEATVTGLPRAGVEVMAGVQHGNDAAVDIDLHQFVARLRALAWVGGMQLPHRQHRGAVPDQIAKALAAVALGNAMRFVAMPNFIEILVGEINEEDAADAAVVARRHAERAAAVFVNPAARVERRWGEFFGLVVATTHQGRAPSLVRPPLDPAQIAPAGANLAEPQFAHAGKFGIDRRGPGAKGPSLCRVGRAPG